MRQKLINFCLSKILKFIVPNDVIRDIKGKLYLGNEEITSQELKALQEEIKALKMMRVWSILTETPKQIAYERGWRDSTTMEHLNTAKTMFSVIQLQESIVDIIKKKIVV
jgi:hypothetical protein